MYAGEITDHWGKVNRWRDWAWSVYGRFTMNPVHLLEDRLRRYGTPGMLHRLYSRTLGWWVDVEVDHLYECSVFDVPPIEPGTCLVVAPEARVKHEQLLRTAGVWEELAERPPGTAVVLNMMSGGRACGRLLVCPQDQPSLWRTRGGHVEPAHRGQGRFAIMVRAAAHFVAQREGASGRLRLEVKGYNRAVQQALQRQGITAHGRRVKWRIFGVSL